MKRLLRWLVPAGFRGQVAAILVLGVVLSQGLAALLYVVSLPQWERVLRPDLAVAKVAMVVRLLEAVPVPQRPGFAGLWDEPGFLIRYDPAGVAAPPGGPADAALRGQLVSRLQRDAATVRVTGAPHEPGSDTRYITVLLKGGGAVQITTAVGLAIRVGLLEQLANLVFLVIAATGLWCWVTRTVNQPLDRFARAAERVGVDVNAPPLASCNEPSVRSMRCRSGCSGC